MKRKIILFLLFWVFYPGLGFTKCNSAQSTQQLFYCAVEKSPTIDAEKKAVEASGLLEKKASQIPNPELESEYLRADKDGSNNNELSIGLFQNIEFGGKRAAREKISKSRHNLSRSKFRSVKEKQVLKVSRAIQRLRQITHESELIDEGIDTYRKIIKNYKGRPSLSAEQQVSFEMFQMASEDYRFIKTSLSVEKQKHLNFLRLETGLSVHNILKNIPIRLPEWPELEAPGAKGLREYSGMMRATGELELSHANLDQQRGERWPDLKIGPVFSKEMEAGARDQKYGLGVSFPLPLFQANGGGVAQAKSELFASQIRHKNEKVKTEYEWEFLYNKYHKIKSDLNLSFKISSIEKRHQKIERFFFKGLISSSLVIEAHRQLLEFFRHRHELELEGLSALWGIKIFQGKINEISM